MPLADVNAFVYVQRRESERHDAYRRWIAERLGGPEPFGVSQFVVGSFVRMVTNHRIQEFPPHRTRRSSPVRR
jgi:predicted nucleic acid-binding protein